MKKILSIMLVVSMVAVMSVSVAFADEQPELVADVEVTEVDETVEVEEDAEENDEIYVYVDGEKIEFDVLPQLVNERTMVPMRFIFEKLGAVVSFDEETETVTAFHTNEDEETTIVILQIGNSLAFTNSTQIELDAPPVLVDSRTLVPIRFVSESLGYSVDWEEDSKSVIITSKTEDADDVVIVDENVETEDTIIQEDGDDIEFYDEEYLEDELYEEEYFEDEEIIEE